MNNTQQMHDPHKILANLRDHLARHDKPIAFLFGAGTSCAISVAEPDDKDKTRPLIPAVARLTEICWEEASGLGEKYAKAWQLIEVHCKESLQEANVENILSALTHDAQRRGYHRYVVGPKKG